ncbi:hypothetical protein CTEN210_00703 [Chaetoceros tenuissimus]|uniref:Uncharacterized protein n=1 Tax=Chaetoceros tenuissimus TaxID=426638 RepID=A0AAD3CEM5_9STRA|nr:hypothetical protein CTEN210_00703 [Chaetoceros tenuissimus]
MSTSTSRILAEKIQDAPRIQHVRIQKSHNFKMSQSSSDISNENTGKKLSLSYKLASMAYFTQILMAFRQKSGLNLLSTNSMGGPLLASFLTYTLSKNESIVDQDGTSKFMNGVLMIYTFVCLSVTGFLPKFQDIYTNLFIGTAIITLLPSIKGYSRTWPSSGIEGILNETKRIMPRIHKANFYTIPKTPSTISYMVCMVAVIVLKMEQILSIAMNPSFSSQSPMWMALKINRLAELSVLGGSLVTLRDASNEDILGQSRFRILNILACYVFGSYAVATSNALMLGLLVSSVISCLGNVIFAHRHME